MKKKNKNLISNSSFVVYISIVFISVKEEKMLRVLKERNKLAV